MLLLLDFLKAEVSPSRGTDCLGWGGGRRSQEVGEGAIKCSIVTTRIILHFKVDSSVGHFNVSLNVRGWLVS